MRSASLLPTGFYGQLGLAGLSPTKREVASAPPARTAKDARVARTGNALRVDHGLQLPNVEDNMKNNISPFLSGRRFRETLWFKEGAAQSARNEKALEQIHAGMPIEASSDALPIEDRYLDDDTLTDDDRREFSLTLQD